MRRLKPRREQGRWILSEAANGLSLAPSWEKDCCSVLQWEHRRRHGSENKEKWQENEKPEENTAGGVGERKGEGTEGRCRRRRGSKGLGMSDAFPCFHVPPLQEDCPSQGHSGEKLWLIHPVLGCSSPNVGRAWDYTRKKKEKSRAGDREAGKKAWFISSTLPANGPSCFFQ